MRLSEYVDHDATGLASLVKAGDVTSLELTRLARAAHDEINPRINAVIEFYDDAEAIAGAEVGVFQGVPFLRKDIGATEAGRLQEQGSRLFKGCRPETDSYYFRRARDAGLRTIGRTTCPEFGTSGMSESILNGITGNPWNLERSAGGSSSGAAAAVAAGITPIAHASDGGGSIRIPASWCGLVGLNPSRGRISGGPNNQDASFGRIREFVLCRTVRDIAAALDVFSGPHPGDPFIIVQPSRPYVDELSRKTGTLRVGVARTKWGGIDVEPDVLQAVDTSFKQWIQLPRFWRKWAIWLRRSIHHMSPRRGRRYRSAAALSMQIHSKMQRGPWVDRRGHLGTRQSQALKTPFRRRLSSAASPRCMGRRCGQELVTWSPSRRVLDFSRSKRFGQEHSADTARRVRSAY